MLLSELVNIPPFLQPFPSIPPTTALYSSNPSPLFLQPLPSIPPVPALPSYCPSPSGLSPHLLLALPFQSLPSPPTAPPLPVSPLTSTSHRVQHSQLSECILEVLPPPRVGDRHKRLNNQVTSLGWRGVD